MSKILIVDDHPAIRMAVKMLLEQDGHHVLAEVDNGVDAISAAKINRPDIVVLDIGIPKLDGIEVIKRLKLLDIGTRILVLSAQSTHHIMVRCLQAGAEGFLSKLDDLSLLKDAIAKIEKKLLYYPREVIAGARHAHTVDREDLLSSLSSREMSVLLQICQGHANKQIAQSMLLSEKTVSTYKTRLMKKLNITNIVDLISLARRQKLL
ncbi:response regulator transcription factor [Aeromonas veronii]|uniref:response regulator transcription factor n=1 Tax=Aeromonas TaxID=642 RepID=UPI001F2C7FF5|nr:response regulator transcription factor [Aeromonas veronii]MCF5909353.1 response regulator transcription factor [Aeromonas veronii]MCO5343171.1 response regulator transcription factor [Aeromonas veronii]